MDGSIPMSLWAAQMGMQKQMGVKGGFGPWMSLYVRAFVRACVCETERDRDQNITE